MGINKIYFIKNLSTWMLDELISFSEYTKFKVVILREPPDFYKKELKKLQNNDIEIIIKPFRYNYLFKKIIFIIHFFLKNLSKFSFDYNGIIGAKSLLWFLQLDLNIFSKNSCVYAQFATQTSLISLMLKLFYKKDFKYYVTFHAYDIYFNNKWFEIIVNNSMNTFSISEFNIKYVLNKYKRLCNEKISLSRLGVFLPHNQNDIIKSNKFVFTIGTLSWFVEKKGLFYLLEAMKMLKDENIKLLLAGDGPLKEEIIKFIENNNLNDSIIYVGKIKGDEKAEFFNTIDVFILPSITLPNDMDGIPVVLMEAISYGLPIISTNISGIPEICINDYNGILIKQKDVNEIINAIKRLKNNESLIKMFSYNSLRLSNKYDIEKNSKDKLKKMNWIN